MLLSKVLYRIPQLAIIIIVTLAASSCSQNLRPFTADTYSDLRGSSSALSKVQFYLSDDIVLYRDYSKNTSRIENGKIKVRGGREIEEVVFRKGTPGVFVFSPDRQKIAVSFEEGEDSYLVFGASKKRNGRYVLLAKDWSLREGTIEYRGRQWRTSNQSAFTTLMIDVENSSQVSRSRSTASGRKIR